MMSKVSDLLDCCERLDCGEIDLHPFQLYAEQKIELDCGVSVKISDIYQFHTYGGMLCGNPRPVLLDRYVEQSVGVAGRMFPNLDPQRVAIIPPVISFGTTVKTLTPAMARRVGLGEDVKEHRIAWEMLPKISTVAVLQMTTSFDSVLAIWWQGELGYPDANVLNQICKLNWADHMCESDP